MHDHAVAYTLIFSGDAPAGHLHDIRQTHLLDPCPDQLWLTPETHGEMKRGWREEGGGVAAKWNANRSISRMKRARLRVEKAS